MSPGDRVRVKGSLTAKVLEVLEDGKVLLDTPDGPLPYTARNCKVLGRHVPPACLQRVDERKLAAVQLLDAGVTAREVAARYGVTVHAVHSWRKEVRDAAEDAKAAARLAR